MSLYDPTTAQDDSTTSDPTDFDPVSLRERQDGWTSDRQRAFILALAETGSVSSACRRVGISPMSAYRMRTRRDATTFRAAWARALGLATARLTAIAFDRAINGNVETVWKDGVCVKETRRYDNRLLMFLLKRHNQAQYELRVDSPVSFVEPPMDTWSRMMEQDLGLMDDVTPDQCPADPLTSADYLLPGALSAGADAADRFGPEVKL